MTEPTRPCGTCGMPCTPGEYHPYAACLMFKACHNSETVRANLEAVRATPPAVAGEPVAYLHDDGYWTAAKTDVGRSLNDRLLFAGSPKVAVYTTPQPTQAQAGAVPLTSAQIEAAAPEYSVDDFLDFNAGVRFAEQHHGIGIKGGQHGL